MIEGKKVLGLIPARGGSKGIPRKNVRLLGGKPLIAWTINEAEKSNYIDRLIVSTDDTEIAETARNWGAEVPFMRPAELASDTARGIDVVLHAIRELPRYDVVVLLQPTSPFRTVEDIDGAIQLWTKTGDSVVGVTESSMSPYWMYSLGGNGQLTELFPKPPSANRQDLPSAYVLNGAIYTASADNVRKYESFLRPVARAYVMPVDRSVDLDSPFDWEYAEYLVSRKHLLRINIQ